MIGCCLYQPLLQIYIWKWRVELGTISSCYWFKMPDDTCRFKGLFRSGHFTSGGQKPKKNNAISSLHCAVFSWERSSKIEVYREPTHTDKYLLFDSHHPQEHKLGVIITLHHRAENLPATAEIQDKGRKHLREALKPYHYPNLVRVEVVENITLKTGTQNRHVLMSYVAWELFCARLDTGRLTQPHCLLFRNRRHGFIKGGKENIN